LTAARLNSQSPPRQQVAAASVFHAKLHAVAAVVFYFIHQAGIQALAPPVFHFSHNSAQQALASRVFHPGCTDLAPMFFHPDLLYPG